MSDSYGERMVEPVSRDWLRQTSEKKTNRRVKTFKAVPWIRTSGQPTLSFVRSVSRVLACMFFLRHNVDGGRIFEGRPWVSSWREEGDRSFHKGEEGDMRSSAAQGWPFCASTNNLSLFSFSESQ